MNIVLVDTVFKVIDKLIPDKEAAAKLKFDTLKLQQDGEFKELDATVQLALGQMEVNKTEAASNDFFRGGWRPGTGWVCVIGLAFNFVVQPLLSWYSSVRGIPVPPQLDIYELMALLTGMLGLGALRHRERLNGKA